MRSDNIAARNSVMASADVLPSLPSSFVYEDLLERVFNIQNELARINGTIELKSTTSRNISRRPFIFIDPFGNRMKNDAFDHWTIDFVLRKYKKDFCPKYLQAWIQIGFFDHNEVQPIKREQLTETVSEYPENQQFIAFGSIPLFILNEQSRLLQQTTLTVVLNDKSDDIIQSVRRIRPTSRRATSEDSEIQLKSRRSEASLEPNEDRWNEGNDFRNEDTILSAKLYENNTLLMAKMIEKA